MNLANRDYFSIRININTQTTLKMVSEFIQNNYSNYLACFENSHTAFDFEKAVKNDHTHILIWDDGAGSEDFEFNFIEKMKKNLPFTKSKGQFAESHKKGAFERAVRYICKGKKESPPEIYLNSGDFSEAEILEIWRLFWKESITNQKKADEDTSTRLIEILKNEHLEYIKQRVNHWRDNGLDKLKIYAYVTKFWYDAVLDHFYEKVKKYNKKDFADIVQGLILQTLYTDFAKRNQDSIFAICGLSSFERQLIENADDSYLIN